MKGPFIALLVGALVGALLVVYVGIVCRVGLAEFWRGVGYGVGIGFGAVVALALLNFIVTNLDRIASGRS